MSIFKRRQQPALTTWERHGCDSKHRNGRAFLECGMPVLSVTGDGWFGVSLKAKGGYHFWLLSDARQAQVRADAVRAEHPTINQYGHGTVSVFQIQP